jgi:TctA family transporter
MPYIIALAIGLAGLTIIKDALAFAGTYGVANMTFEWVVMLGFGIVLICLGWFIFKETLTKTYTVRRR